MVAPHPPQTAPSSNPNTSPMLGAGRNMHDLPPQDPLHPNLPLPSPHPDPPHPDLPPNAHTSPMQQAKIQQPTQSPQNTRRIPTMPPAENFPHDTIYQPPINPTKQAANPTINVGAGTPMLVPAHTQQPNMVPINSHASQPLPSVPPHPDTAAILYSHQHEQAVQEQRVEPAPMHTPFSEYTVIPRAKTPKSPCPSPVPARPIPRENLTPASAPGTPASKPHGLSKLKAPLKLGASIESIDKLFGSSEKSERPDAPKSPSLAHSLRALSPFSTQTPVDGAVTGMPSSSKLKPSTNAADKKDDQPTVSSININMGEVDREVNFDDDDEDHSADKFKKWIFRFMRTVIIVFLALLPGFITKSYSPNNQLFGWPLLCWSTYISCSCVLYLLCQILISVLHSVIIHFNATNATLVYVVKDLKKYTAFTLWSSLNLIIWTLVPWGQVYLVESTNGQLDPEVSSLLTRFMAWLVCLGLIFLVKFYLLKKLAFRFHRKAYFDRIQESLFAEHVLKLLLKPRPGHWKVNVRKDEEETLTDKHISRYTVTEDDMDGMIKLTRKPWLGLQHEVTGKPSEVAKALWNNVRRKGTSMIALNDFIAFLGPEKGERAFELFDTDKSGLISKTEVKDAVCKILRERKNLQLSLRDTKTTVAKLAILFNFLAILVSLLLLFMVLDKLFTNFVLPVLSSCIMFAFVISSSASKLMESVIFVFVTHAYDVGDRVFIDDENLVVKKINFMNTVFTAGNGQEIYLPNPILLTKKIHNLRRSGACSAELAMDCWYGITNDQIEQLQEAVTRFAEENAGDYKPEPMVCLTNLHQAQKARLVVWFSHRDNFQDGGLRWTRHHKMAMFVKQECERIGIFYTPPTQDIRILTGGNIPSVLDSSQPNPTAMAAALAAEHVARSA